MSEIYNIGDEPVPGYRLLQRLGRGGFGEVWKASAPGKIEVALKIIDLGGDKQGFKEYRAIQLVKRIRHPNLTPITGVWLKDAQGKILLDSSPDDSSWLNTRASELIIAMGLGDTSLAARLQDCRKQGLAGIPVSELLDYMESAAKAIDYLNQPVRESGSHRDPIQHCDIKPLNILIQGGQAQVCDFGLAKALDDDLKQTSQGQGGGSYAYIAPELLYSEGPDKPKPSKTTDQYSLAITYYELRTGSLPFQTTNLLQVALIHLEGKLDFSGLAAPAEQMVLRKATARDPRDRYETTLEMVRRLRDAVEGGTTSRRSGSSGRGKSSFPPGPLEFREGIEYVPGYALVKPLGRGGYGQVWEAVAPGGKHVALKIVTDLENLGGQEYNALELIKGARHAYLIDMHAYWVLDAHGEVISDEIRKQPGAPAGKALVIATELADKSLRHRLEECQPAGIAKGSTALLTPPSRKSITPREPQQRSSPPTRVPPNRDFSGTLRPDQSLLPTSTPVNIRPGSVPATPAPAESQTHSSQSLSPKSEFGLDSGFFRFDAERRTEARLQEDTDPGEAASAAPNVELLALPPNQVAQGIPVDELLDYMRQAAQALDYLNSPEHWIDGRQVAIQHRDVKPDNILLVERVAKVADFGLAKVLEGNESIINSRSGGFTWDYAPPEVFDDQISNSSDQYSLAITYYHLRTGRLPFPLRASHSQIRQFHQKGRLDLSGVADAEREVLAKATKVKPVARYPTCLAMVEALERAVHPDRSTLRPEEIPWKPAELTQGKKWLLTTAALLVVVLTLAGVGVPFYRQWVAEAERKRSEEAGRRAEEASRRAEEERQRKEADRKQKEETLQSALGLLRKGDFPAGYGQLTDEWKRTNAELKKELPRWLGTYVASLPIQKWEEGIDWCDQVQKDFPDLERARLIRTDLLAKVEQFIVNLPAGAVKDPQKATDLYRQAYVESKLFAEKAKGFAQAGSLPNRVLDQWFKSCGRDKGKLESLHAELERLQSAGDSLVKRILVEIDPIIGPAPLSAEALAKQKLADGNLHLQLFDRARNATELASAENCFKEVLDTPYYRSRANLGLARVMVRQPSPNWPDVQSHLREVVETQLEAAERADKSAIEILRHAGNKDEVMLVLDELQRLKKGSPPDPWEAAQIESIRTNVLQSAVDMVERESDLKTASAWTTKILDYDPGNKAAEAHRKELQAITAFQTAEADAQRQKFAKELKQLLAEPAPARPVQLAHTLMEARKDGNIFPIAHDALKSARDKIADADARQEIGRSFVELLAGEIARMREDPRLKQEQFKVGLDYVEELSADQRTPLLLAWRAECLVETGKDPNLAQRDIASALPRLRNKPDEPYACYVSARVAFSQNDDDARQKAADQLCKTYDTAKPPLSAKFRKELAAQMLASAAGKLRTPVDATRPFQSVFPEGTADKAYQWLSKALTLAPSSTDVESTANLAYAAFYKTERDTKTVRERLPALLKERRADIEKNLPGELPALLFVCASAQAESVESREQALEGFKQLVKRIRDEKTEGLEQAAFKTLLAPAIHLGEDICKGGDHPEAQSTLAFFHATRGSLAWRYPELVAEGDNATVAFEAYNRAAQLDGKNPGYLYGRSLASLEIKKPNYLDAIQADATKIRAIAPQHSGAYYLQGRLHQLSGRPEDARPAENEFREALRFWQGSELEAQDKVEFLLGHMDACVRLANHNTVQDRAYLDEAVKDAREVEQLEPGPRQAHALAVALEDVAWLQGKREEFAKAVVQYRRASQGSTSPRFAMGLGRCLLRQGVYDYARSPALCTEALELFKTTLKRKCPIGVEMEARYWLGKAYQIAHKYSEAEAAFRTAKELCAKDPNSTPEWQELCTIAWAQIPLHQAEQEYLDEGKVVNAGLLASAESRAEELTKIATEKRWKGGAIFESARIRGRLLELQDKAADELADRYAPKTAQNVWLALGHSEGEGRPEEYFRLGVAYVTCMARKDFTKYSFEKYVLPYAKTFADSCHVPYFEPALEASACWALGMVLLRKNDLTAQETQEALAQLRRAIQLLPPYDPRMVDWRLKFADQLAIAGQDKDLSDKARDQYHRDAVTQITEALKVPTISEKKKAQARSQRKDLEQK